MRYRADIIAATSTSHRKRLAKKRDKLFKQQVELQTCDEKLHHYADRRISLDLDDGVVVLTADHGFLFTETAPGAPDKSTSNQQPTGTLRGPSALHRSAVDRCAVAFQRHRADPL